MSEQLTLSENLREMYDDMVEAYNDAKINDNVAGQERLSKVIRDLAKQVKDHELHEREVIQRKEAARIWSLLGVMVGKKIKDKYGDESAELIVEIVLDGEDIIANELDK